MSTIGLPAISVYPFNGAATLGLRKDPRNKGKPIPATRLQWSRNFRAAESFLACTRFRQSPTFNGAATLGLRKAAKVVSAPMR